MRNKTFTRVLCLALALLLLVSGAVTVVAADEVVKHDNLTDKTIADYKETLDLISYAEYQNLYYATATKAEKEVSLLLTDENWQFVNGNVIINMTDGMWMMRVSDGKIYKSEEEVVAADVDAVKIAEGDYRVIVKTYNTLDEAKAAGYNVADLAYVTTDYDGVKSVYTPGRGAITWDIDLTAHGIDEKAKTLFSIGLDYYPVVARSTPIEREFFINGKPVFSEAYVLSFSKVWGMFAQGSSTDAGGALADMSAKYTLSKGESLEDIVAAATAAGYEAEGGSGNAPVFKVSDDKSYVVFYQPSYTTPKLSAFVQEYGLRFFPVDFNNNEIRPTQLQAPEWRRYVISDSDGYTHSYELTVGSETTTYDSEYFGFVLEDKFTVTLESVNEPMALSTLTLMPYKAADSYEVYRQKLEAIVGKEQGKDIIKLEAENPTRTSSNVVYPVEDRASALTSPVDPSVQLLNTVGGEKWATAGQWVEYSFSVDSSGWYDIYTRFKQSYLDGMFTSRALTVTTDYGNDEVAYADKFGNTAGYYNGLPFSEASGLRYDYSSDWQVTKLTSTGRLDDKTYQLYFEAGVVYTINLKVTFGTMSATVREIERILEALNDAYLSIVQYTGPTPDAYRDYNFYRMLPDTLDALFAEKEAIANLSKFLREGAGVSSTYTGTCDKLVDLIGKMVIRGGEGVASGLKNFKAYSGGIGTFLGDVKTQPLQIDYLMVQPATAEEPKATPNFFEAFVHEIKSFFWTFFRDYNSMGTAEDYDKDESVVVVWLPSGRDQANVVRNMTVNGFTQKQKIAVNLKLVNGGTLLPSILAGMGPDVYHGLGDDTVINYAIRGALISIEEFPEKYKFDEDGKVKESYVDWETICDQFNKSAMLVFGVPDADDEWHYYGLPESQSFSMMFLRLDILNEIGIEIPKTWDDLYKAQSKLQNHNMEIGVGADYFPFLYQSGGSIWADEGMRINLDSEVALTAFNKMCNMFTQYSFPYDYSGANRFRTGEMPILISGYTGLYNQLKVFATELDGCWTFVPMPGTLDPKTGEINNKVLAGSSAVVMVSGAKHQEDAWEYMKWYTGAEAQATYANEMVAIMGESAKHATANREALASMPWTADEYIEVKKQFDNLLAIENYPGFYYVGRHTSFAFLAAYNDDKDPTAEILRYVNTINAEITRKRQEFNLETVELGSTLAEKRSNQIREALGVLEDRGLINREDELYDQAMYGIVNQNVETLKIAYEMFKDAYLADYDGSEKTITKVSGKTAVVPSYEVNVNKQTLPEAKDGSGGYEIASLENNELLYFISEALLDTANAYESYRASKTS